MPKNLARHWFHLSQKEKKERNIYIYRNKRYVGILEYWSFLCRLQAVVESCMIRIITSLEIVGFHCVCPPKDSRATSPHFFSSLGSIVISGNGKVNKHSGEAFDQLRKSGLNYGTTRVWKLIFLWLSFVGYTWKLGHVFHVIFDTITTNIWCIGNNLCVCKRNM